MNDLNKAYLSLGSNIGDRESNLAQAITALEINHSIENLESASFYHTEPLYNEDQDFFLNTVIGIDTSLKPFQLLDLVVSIEKMLGRNKNRKKNMPRIIDIDILTHAEAIIETNELTIPHPSLALRKFVLIPFDEIATDYKIPLLKLTVNELLKRCVDQSYVGLYEIINKA